MKKLETQAVLAGRRAEGPPAPTAPVRADDQGRLERALATLERGAAAVAFGSGRAAVAAVLQSLAPGDRVVAHRHVHPGTRRLLTELMSRWGLDVQMVDCSVPDEVTVAATDATRLVWVESPSGPRLSLTDLSRVAAVAHRVGAALAVDGTTTTPVVQRPFDHGADLVVHATTSYLSGHGDLVGGAVVVRESGHWLKRLREIQEVAGAVPSGFDCWLLLRSLATLPMRMRAHSAGADLVASYLETHPAVAEVAYPGLPHHPGHELARRQMEGFGAAVVFSLVEPGLGLDEVVDRLEVIRREGSPGGPDSVARQTGGRLHLDVGLEAPDDLVADLENALAPPA